MAAAAMAAAERAAAAEEEEEELQRLPVAPGWKRERLGSLEQRAEVEGVGERPRQPAAGRGSAPAEVPGAERGARDRAEGRCLGVRSR